MHYSRKSPERGIHIMFAFVDHFEPGNRNATAERQKSRVDAWVKRYPELASRHLDSDGICPQHTFFFPPHYNSHDHLERIVGICSKGYGEVEMHLHHDHQMPWPDDGLSLETKIKDCIKSFSKYGVFCLPNGKKTYGFIHGDWALANSLKDGMHCGVNDELTILQKTGCYADFTFPVSNEAQPKYPNTLLYAQSSPAFPKGYNKSAIPIKTGRIKEKGLMLIQGVLGCRWKSRTHKFFPSIEQSNIDTSDFPFSDRIDYWVKKRICVEGKPNWIFIKVHTHGSREEDRDILLGKNAHAMYNYLETKYKDNKKFFLHYVSAREMYNIIKAAEAGRTGNPNAYRDYLLPRYIYLPNRHNQF